MTLLRCSPSALPDQTFERAIERALEIHWRETGGPVFHIAPVRLSGFTRRAQRLAAVRGREFKPPFPQPITHRCSARAGRILRAVARSQHLVELHENFSHVIVPP